MELAVIKKMLTHGIMPGKLGLTEELLVDEEGKRAYKFVLNFFAQYGKLPEIPTVERECNLRLDVIDATEPLDFYLNQLRTRWKLNRIGDFNKKAAELLNKSPDPEPVLGLMKKLIRDTVSVGGVQIWNAAEAADRKLVLDDYEKLKTFQGKPIGIETPWPFINETTGGIRDGFFVSIIAQSATGKTWFLLKLAEHAHKQKKSVLFISPEMSQEIVRYRFAAVYLGLSYSAFTKGLLTTPEEERLKRFVEDPLFPPAVILDAAVVQSVEQVELAVQEHRPDLLLIDSYYLLSLEGRYSSTSERREAITIALYNQAKRLKIPYVVSTHFSSSVKKDKKGEGEDVGYTKQAYRLADLALGLYRDEEMDANKVMLLKILKHREGVKAEILMNFDLDQMTFSELRVKSASSEFGYVSKNSTSALPTLGAPAPAGSWGPAATPPPAASVPPSITPPSQDDDGDSDSDSLPEY